jgi:hypothetical protein
MAIVDPVIPPAGEHGTPEQPALTAGIVTAALTATVPLLVVTDVIDEEGAAVLTGALAAWVLVAFAWVRSRVTARRRI